MNHYIYEITNNINGMKYIGKRSCHCEIEKDRYMGGGSLLRKAQKKLGIENFTKRILAIADDDDMVLDLESYYIEKRNAVESDMYYNQVYGGSVTHMFKHNEKDKQELVRKRISEKNKGTNAGVNSRVAKKVICLNTKEVFVSATEAANRYGLHRGSVSKVCRPNYPTNIVGKHPETDEPLEWMFYDIYLASLEGKEVDMEAKSAPVRRGCKAVICLNTKEIFNSTKDAADNYGLRFASGIGKACKDGVSAGTHPETKEKLKWMYYEDYMASIGGYNNE